MKFEIIVLPGGRDGPRWILLDGAGNLIDTYYAYDGVPSELENELAKQVKEKLR